MAQQFIGLDDAAKQLGTTKEKLNELREKGTLRAYRDGASWKFRTDEIDKLSESGELSADNQEAADSAAFSWDSGAAGESSEGSDLSLDLDFDDASDDATASKSSGLDLGDLSLDEDMGNEDTATEEDTGKPAELSDLELASASDLSLEEEKKPAAADKPGPGEVAAGSATSDDDDDLVLDLDPLEDGDDAESILMSEAELGDTGGRPPSTIIGKADLDLATDDDLDLAIGGDDDAARMSDVKLAASMSDVFTADDGGSEIIPGAESPSGKFEDLEELEIDLEAESSRILEDEDLVAAKEAAAKQASEKKDQESTEGGDSDLMLAPTDSGVAVGGLSGVSKGNEDDEDDISLTGISSLELDDGNVAGGSGSIAGLSGLSALELADDEDDDFVLGDDDSGSDITMSSADSGINLNPSDSGLALDEAPLDLGGSAMGSSLDLGDALADAKASGGQEAAELAPSEDFLLTPLGDDDDDDEDDSSQVIALDAVDEEENEDALLGDGMGGDGGLAVAGAGGATVATVETAFPTWIVVFLGLNLCIMILSGVMMVDVLRNIWSWEEPYSLSSALIEGLLGMVGIK